MIMSCRGVFEWSIMNEQKLQLFFIFLLSRLYVLFHTENRVKCIDIKFFKGCTMKKLNLCYVCLLLFVFFPFTYSATYYVDNNQLDDSGSGISWAAAKKTITAALSVAFESGDQIFVREGTYSESDLLMNQGLSVYGGFNGTETELSDRDYILNRTVLQKSGSTTFTAISGRLDGFDLINYDKVLNEDSQYTVFANCRIFGNVTIGDIGGTLYNCLIYGNNSNAELHILSGATVQSCTITNNDYLLLRVDSSSTFTNTIYSGNGGELTLMSTFYVYHCLWSSDIGAYIFGDGNVMPATAVFVNSTSDEYTDLRLAAGSPGISMGTAPVEVKDYYGLSRPYSGSVDIGACEYNQVPSVSVTSTSPVFLTHDAMEFPVEGTCSDPEGAVKSIYVTGSDFEKTTLVSDTSWSMNLPANGSSVEFQTFSLDEGYARSSVITDTFTVQKVIPTASIVSHVYEVVLPYSQAVLNVDVLAEDDNGISEIIYRFGDTTAWISSSEHTGDTYPIMLTDIAIGLTPLFVKAKDLDDYESETHMLRIVRLPERIYIDCDSTTPSGLTWENAYPSILQAVSAYSGYPMEFWVAEGTYLEGAVVFVEENHGFFGGFNGTETSFEQRNITSNKAIINGENAHRCLEISGMVDGFYLTNGNFGEAGGGGAYIYQYGELTRSFVYSNETSNMGGGINNHGIVSFCEVYSNTAGSGGGGISSAGSVNNCQIYDNNADNAGGLYLFTSSYLPLVKGGYPTDVAARNCLIYNNEASDYAGGVLCNKAPIYGCTIYGNHAANIAGGLAANREVRSCIIYGNSCDSGEVDVSGDSNASFVSSCFTGTPSAQSITACISENPLFIATSGNADSWNLSLQDSSPCINTGSYSEDISDQLDIENHNRLYGSQIDMGAYEINRAPILTVTQPSGSESVPFSVTSYSFLGMVSDPEMLVGALFYRINEGSWNSVEIITGPFSIDIPLAVGNTAVDLYASDQGGSNIPSAVSESRSYTITRAENTVPDLSITTTSQSVNFSHAPITITGSASDVDCGLRALECRINSASWSDLIPSGSAWSYVLTPALGDNLFEVRATDCGADYGGSDLISTQSITITRKNQISVDFNASMTSAQEDSTVNFTDTSTGDLIGWNWDFDHNGVVDSTQQNPSWVYPDPGLFSVSLKVSDGVTEMTEIKNFLMSIYPSDALDYDAGVITDTIPASMSQGETYSVEITMQNTGKTIWLNSQPIYLGAMGDSDPLISNEIYLRVDALRDVRYGESGTFVIEMKPLHAGTYRTDWQMMMEGVAWFGSTLEKDVTVEPGTAVRNKLWIIYQ